MVLFKLLLCHYTSKYSPSLSALPNLLYLSVRFWIFSITKDKEIISAARYIPEMYGQKDHSSDSDRTIRFNFNPFATKSPKDPIVAHLLQHKAIAA
jgi:hypothetical protein